MPSFFVNRNINRFFFFHCKTNSIGDNYSKIPESSSIFDNLSRMTENVDRQSEAINLLTYEWFSDELRSYLFAIFVRKIHISH